MEAQNIVVVETVELVAEVSAPEMESTQELNGHADAAPVSENVEKEPAAAATTCAFSRVAALPIVADASNKVASLYSSLKSSHECVQSTLERVEEAVATGYNYVVASEFVNQNIVPRIKTFEKLVGAQLDSLEERYPIVKAPTEKVMISAKETAQPAVDYVYAKVEPIINYVHAHTTSAGAA